MQPLDSSDEGEKAVPKLHHLETYNYFVSSFKLELTIMTLIDADSLWRMIFGNFDWPPSCLCPLPRLSLPLPLGLSSPVLTAAQG